MYIGYDEEQQNLRRELRDYYDGLLTPEVRAELSRTHQVGECMREVVRRMGADGWIGLSGSKALGGKEMAHVEQYIFTDEVVRSGFAYPFLTTESMQKSISRWRSRAYDLSFSGM